MQNTIFQGDTDMTITQLPPYSQVKTEIKPSCPDKGTILLIGKKINELMFEGKIPHFPKHMLICPHAIDVQERINAWLISIGIPTNKLAAIEKYQIGMFMGLTHPLARFSKLEIASEVALSLYVFDDSLEKAPDMKTVSKVQQQLLSIFIPDQQQNESFSSPGLKGFQDVWKKLKCTTSEMWQARFIEDIKLYCDGTKAEADYRFNHKIPTLSEYKTLRIKTSATLVMFDLIEFMESISIPKKIFDDLKFQEFRIIGANNVNWANDLLSAQREISNGETFNLVSVIQAESKCTFIQAIKESDTIFRAALQQFEQKKESNPFDEDDAKTYIKGIETWYKGHFLWATKFSSRYQQNV